MRDKYGEIMIIPIEASNTLAVIFLGMALSPGDVSTTIGIIGICLWFIITIVLFFVNIVDDIIYFKQSKKNKKRR